MNDKIIQFPSNVDNRKESPVYLNYYQVMAFLLKISELKEVNPSFKDKIVETFEEYVIERAIEIEKTNPKIILKIIPNGDKYKISSNLLDYLANLTSVDVFDKETMEKSIEKTIELEQKIIEENFGIQMPKKKSKKFL